ncbi:hypothetical protein M409DRAFT_68226 [Zasmidium cellare ATCC 36951]|uniref:Uncharacterized protein n=1 Tax=Zasmidium cellare ATCC 36951 TaxID=1080233 RepID=A0A6A6CB07_ZASCE|nr:uncharacterized protein M409DRAFT_68226 [Zasmidium cellare ATCC 36951]KAF2163983.1 hypothetical protein M409DRAFT_68226 [Zasmidium cellare ATCC 36951]
MEPRLLNTTTLTFELPLQIHQEEAASEHSSKRPYVILSHCWASNNDHEVKYDDIISGWKRQKPGFPKVEGTARQARKEGLDWIWIDTCCIDKRSSAETTEAINSMYRWYEEADRCYVYLQDVGPGSDISFRQSRWFKRGWTLQELIAPAVVEFFDSEWTHLGSKETRANEISECTGIHVEVLLDRKIKEYSIAQKMSWAADRETTKSEDRAYCLLGLFNINMVPIYGEGERAFIRLQEELIRNSDDHTIFAWSMDPTKYRLSGLLAPSHRHFKDCSSAKALNRWKGQCHMEFHPRPSRSPGTRWHLAVEVRPSP